MSDLEQIVAKMRELGVTRYKDGEIEVELGAAPPVKPDGDDEVARKRDSTALEDRRRFLRTLFGASSIQPRLRK